MPTFFKGILLQRSLQSHIEAGILRINSFNWGSTGNCVDFFRHLARVISSSDESLEDVQEKKLLLLELRESEEVAVGLCRSGGDSCRTDEGTRQQYPKPSRKVRALYILL